jgi:hypothetical protein
MKSRRRSLSASRTLDSTAKFVGRIGASLRISARRKSKVSLQLQSFNVKNLTTHESWKLIEEHM